MSKHPLTLLALIALSCSAPVPKPIIEEMNPPAVAGASLPHLVRGEDGYLYLSWVQKVTEAEPVNAFWFARFDGASWSEPEEIARGTGWFVNWADYPMISADASGNLLAHYLAKSGEGTYAYDVNLMFKPKGKSWQGPVVAHADSTQTEHGFVTLLPSSEAGTFQVFWLDGRNTGGHSDSHQGVMTLRTAQVNMQGEMRAEMELDPKTCDCCQTTALRLTNGQMLVAYRDRDDKEVRDISVVRGDGASWSAPDAVSRDGWVIQGCPVNGPRLDAHEHAVAMAWFTAAEGRPRIQVKWSDDYGDTFGLLQEIAGQALGRVDIALQNPREGWVSWMSAGDTSYLTVRKVDTSRTEYPSINIAPLSSARSSGFPQMATYKNKVYLAWTGPSGIRMASLHEE